MAEIWAAAIGAVAAVAGVGTSLYEGAQNREAANKALDASEANAEAATYQPINISQLQQEATQASIANATASLQLQKQLQPGVYAANQTLQKQVAQNVAAGGNLTPDETSQVASQARIAGGSSGAVGGVGPYTAALTGQSAAALINQREGQAAALSAANPAPAVGLSASDLASATIANQNAQNEFTLSKLGVNSNLINSQAQITAANNGATAGGINSSLTGAAAIAKAFNTPAVTTGSSAANPFVTNPSLSDQSSFDSDITNIANTTGSAPGGYGGDACWVAREIFGIEDPRWMQFREWMLDHSPRLFRWSYLRFGRRFAEFLRKHPSLKPAIRSWMESRIA